MNYSRYFVALSCYAAGALLTSGLVAQIYAPRTYSYYPQQFVPGLQLIGIPLTAETGVQPLKDVLKASDFPDGAVAFKLQTGSTQSTERASQDLTALLASFPSHLQAPILITANADQIHLEWFGQIHEAAAITGPFNEITNAASPLSIQAKADVRFWRALARLTVSEELFSASVVLGGEWSHPSMPVVHGEALLVFNPLEKQFQSAMTGEVLFGDLTNAIPAGLSLRSSKIPKEGKITTDLNLRLLPGDHLFLLRNRELQHFIYQHGDTWFPEEPTIELGEGVIIYAHRPLVWNQHLELE